MKFKQQVAISKIVEHPENKNLFQDIKTTSPTFWEQFKDSIKEFGILEPLIVNETSMQVRSGNQRLKAAVELGIEDVPVIFVEDETSDNEISKMIASNVFRRTIDPFSMFEYIGRLRKGSHSKSGSKEPKEIAQRQAQDITQKHKSFVSASDIFNSLPIEQQEALKEWFESKKNGTEGELIAELKRIQNENLEKDKRVKELTDLSKSKEEREKTLQDLLDEKNKEIEELKESDNIEEVEIRDAQIRELEQEKRLLKDKLKKAEQNPDLSYRLEECIKRQLDTNAMLKDLITNIEYLEKERISKLFKLFQTAVKIIKDNMPQETKLIEEAQDD
jgi:ParB-like chromosome segregation protein Spo0J